MSCALIAGSSLITSEMSRMPSASVVSEIAMTVPSTARIRTGTRTRLPTAHTPPTASGIA